ncbi:hypothetical protein A2871_01840 [Candidatus Daviesbacteria bacterium RIFCSPHIGHO2_01_FULL_41_23]|uniref:Trehalase n=1 Tax=Candidatus Daviesbacteria bacterium RIFCSPHIGHO2_01_FULL_41_23 TaxID=1797764 RepID=A0A1F5IR32_9BACT|nr:MAG: hypothetical protein A2871_01840 [Candidatus Daviesbacteria bacterium RIFCSPHIGHO2_01_FULL_41_23]
MQSKTSWENKFSDCLEYIDSYWNKIIREPEKRKINRRLITIPKPYVVPNDKKFNFIFYWDSYFIFQGLNGTKRSWVMKSMIENFMYLYEKYHLIPNFNAESSLGRSQPPFFTSMILETFENMIGVNNFFLRFERAFSRLIKRNNPEKFWLAKAFETAKQEYTHVWIDQQKLYHHSVSGFKLQRYGDRDLGYDHSSELESGWDLTSRFYNRASNFLQIDLNSYLFKYETDFEKIAMVLGNKKEAKHWAKTAQKRRLQINKFMWYEKSGFFFDYSYIHKRQSSFYSLAGFIPLWAGLASKKQAEQMVKKLLLFETDYGLAICAKKSLAPKIDPKKIPIRYRSAIEGVLKPKQWDYPNIWPPLEYLTVMGLLNYGYSKEAIRIMQKSVKAHAALFRKYKTFFEKINGETGDKPNDFHYPTQTGFGWTNAIFYKYIKLLDNLEAQ